MKLSYIVSTILVLQESIPAVALVAPQPRSRDRHSLFMKKDANALKDATDTNADLQRRNFLAKGFGSLLAAVVTAPAPAEASLSKKEVNSITEITTEAATEVATEAATEVATKVATKAANEVVDKRLADVINSFQELKIQTTTQFYSLGVVYFALLFFVEIRSEEKIRNLESDLKSDFVNKRLFEFSVFALFSLTVLCLIASLSGSNVPRLQIWG